MQRAQLIRKLVLDSQYVIDEHLIAAAIVARAATRRAVGEMAFRNDVGAARRPRTVRSFRPSSEVPSFRPYTMRGFHNRRRGPHAGLI